MALQRLKESRSDCGLLDGDRIRESVGDSCPVLGTVCHYERYTTEARRAGAYGLFRQCRYLAEQGKDVVCCSISMYSDVRQWNRENIPNYKEIYIKASKDTLTRRNQKGLYSEGKNVVGIDLPFDEPRSPDIVLPNDGERTPLELVERLERVLYPNIVEDTVDNSAYWNQYYKNRVCSEEPSPFAQYVSTLVEPGRSMVELGCGNGRDSV